MQFVNVPIDGKFFKEKGKTFAKNLISMSNLKHQMVGFRSLKADMV